MKYSNVKEEELKNKIAKDYFGKLDCGRIVGNIDFCVTLPSPNKKQDISLETESMFWAEAKTRKFDPYKSIVQLILTIGKARTFDKEPPPKYLGAFDCEKIAFIEYNEIHEIFYENDFNWNVTPSDHSTREFEIVLNRVKEIIQKKSLIYDYERDNKELKAFIKKNFVVGKAKASKLKIDKNNFVVVYNKWLQDVKPTIEINWNIAKQNGIIDGDFYLADLLSLKNKTIKDKLFVVLKHDEYELDREITESGLFNHSTASFKDGQKGHNQFWNKYERPPKEEYWDYIVKRRDLLVPQDVRERKGSYFTPKIWVELSQKYLADALGEDWQDEYYIWDCAAGTGNLLNGLTNKYNIWASTIDKQDVEVMKDRIQNGANLLENQVFQFDFLNDDFSKLPEGLKRIINNPAKLKRLIVYINPPYAEVSSVGEKGKPGVNKSIAHDEYAKKVGAASREIYIMFFARIHDKLNGCILAEFSTLKFLLGSAFCEFRSFFLATLLKSFVVPADTFDNVKGSFPIGFKIWNTDATNTFKEAVAYVYDATGNFMGLKTLKAISKDNYINKWISQNKVSNDFIGFLAGTNSNDFQHNSIVYIINRKEQMANPRGIWISQKNIIKAAVYFSVRKVIRSDWLNDRDQFLFPSDGWEDDVDFQNDCLAFTLFNNNISHKNGTNHWIPFKEKEVNAKGRFDSNFMWLFINGKPIPTKELEFIEDDIKRTKALAFSEESTDVFKVGRKLWCYYHQQPNCNVNASFYDIRVHFQGGDKNGKMNKSSDDKTYMSLIDSLREELKHLSKKIEPKVYKYEFLKQ